MVHKQKVGHNSATVGATIFLIQILLQTGYILPFYGDIGDNIRNGESFSTNLHSMGKTISFYPTSFVNVMQGVAKFEKTS